MAPKPMRLPPLRVLRVRNPNKEDPNPCLPIMSSVLACWASTGAGSAACASIENSLRVCMDGPPAPARPKNNINYHLSRFQKYLEGNTRKNKKK